MSFFMASHTIPAGGAELVPGAMPAFDSAGTTTASATLAGTKAIAQPAVTADGDLMVCLAFGENSNADAALAMHADMVADDWQHVTGSPIGPGAHAVVVAWKVTDVDEAGANIPGGIVATGGVTSDTFLGVCLRFTAADGFAAVPYESASEAVVPGSSSHAMATVTPAGVNRLGVHILFLRDDLALLGNSTGETGGDWTEVLDIETALGGQLTIQVQVADLSAGDPITGGATASDFGVGGRRFAFALVPASVAP